MHKPKMVLDQRLFILCCCSQVLQESVFLKEAHMQVLQSVMKNIVEFHIEPESSVSVY